MDPQVEILSGAVIRNHIVVGSYTNKRLIGNKGETFWRMKCLGCGKESDLVRDKLEKLECSSKVCRIPVSQEKMPPITDPRWEVLVLPTFERLPLTVQQLKTHGQRNSIAWMEEHGWVVFNTRTLMWEEHPRHLRSRLTKQTKKS